MKCEMIRGEASCNKFQVAYSLIDKVMRLSVTTFQYGEEHIFNYIIYSCFKIDVNKPMEIFHTHNLFNDVTNVGITIRSAYRDNFDDSLNIFENGICQPMDFDCYIFNGMGIVDYLNLRAIYNRWDIIITSHPSGVGDYNLEFLLNW